MLDPEHASPMSTQVDTISPPSKPREVGTIWRAIATLLGKRNSKFRPFSKANVPPSTDFDNDSEALAIACDVKETWFAGCHSDVGGGAVDNNVALSLSDIPLRWMIRQVVLSQVGIMFDPEALVRADIDVAAISQFIKAAPVESPSSLGGKTQTKLDAFTAAGHKHALEDPVQSSATERGQGSLQPTHDLLKNPMWWILEMFPMQYSWQGPDGAWHRKLGINIGKGRKIHDESPRFHVSVKERMEDPELKYIPKAKWKKGTEVYVE